jgi:hypothetical protein
MNAFSLWPPGGRQSFWLHLANDRACGFSPGDFRQRDAVHGDSAISFPAAYGIGSLDPAAEKARNRNTQLSHTPQA